MPRVYFILELSESGPPPAAAALWLDTSRDDQIDLVQERVVLGTLDGRRWMGSKDVEQPTGMSFFLKFICPSRTTWSFVARTDNAVLYEFKDQVTIRDGGSLLGSLK